MKKLTPKPLRALWLASAGLAPAVVLLLLGASPPLLAAQQSDDFDGQSDANWTRYTAPATNGYGAAIYSFPTNPAGPAGNYAYRIQAPPITFDTNLILNPRAGVLWSNTEALYGVQDANAGRFSVGVDLIAWRTDWSDEVIGLGWYVPNAGFMTIKAYLAGWGPDTATIGIASFDFTAPSGTPPYAIVGQVAQGSTVLKTDHQYRIVASSDNGYNFLVQLFDRAQTNTPWQSAISEDYTFMAQPGYCALLAANIGTPPPLGGNTTQGADVTFDNYHAYLPAIDATPATLPATVTDAYPPPAGSPAEYYPTVSVGILNRDTAVKPETILLYMDGVLVPSGARTNDTTGVHKPNPGEYPKDFPGVTVSYPVASLLAQGWHTNTIVFQDDQELALGQYVWHTNTWSWMALSPSISLYASNSLPIGSLSLRGFDARLVESLSTSSDPAVYTNYANINAHAENPAWFTVLPDGLASAFAVLNYQYQVSYAATNIVPVVNFNRNNEPINGIATVNFPGLCLPAGYAHVNSFAVDVQAYLQLTAGVHRFHVNSDDAVAIYSGTNPNDTSAPLYLYNGVANADFDFLVPADGLYPIRVVMEEGMGGAYVNLYSVDLQTGAKTVVNADGGVPAFYPLVCKSATSVKGPYTVVTATNAVATANALCESGTGPVVNQTVMGGTNTVALPNSARYYRLDGPRKTRITGINKSGSALAIPYTY